MPNTEICFTKLWIDSVEFPLFAFRMDAAMQSRYASSNDVVYLEMVWRALCGVEMH